MIALEKIASTPHVGKTFAATTLRDEFSGLVKANSSRSFKFHGRLTPGRYVFAALMRATMNPDRTKLLVSAAFTVR